MLKFDNSFFRDEVREGFYVSGMMKRCWGACLVVLNEVIEICKRNDIRIFADYGTLLGAVRHGGFIPWDDDVDICVFRADLPHFIEAVRREAPEHWEVLECDSQDKGFFQPWYRVVNRTGSLIPPDELDDYAGFMYPRGIDVFIIDYLPADKDVVEVMKVIYVVMYNIFFDEDATDEEFESSVRHSEELLGMELMCSDRKATKSRAMKVFQNLISMYGEADSDDMFTKACAQEYGKQRYKGVWLRDTVDIPFENIMVPAPARYDEYLRSIYGDYNIVVRGGTSHDYPSYKKAEKKYSERINTDFSYRPGREKILDQRRRRSGPDQEEVVFFLPLEGDKWEFFEQAYLRETEKERCWVFVMPIPFFVKDSSGELKEQLYLPDSFSDRVDIVRTSEINIEAYDIDRIYIQCPYDERNTAITVHPYFYAPHLRQMCKELIYIPPFRLYEPGSEDDVLLATFENFVSVPGVVYADSTRVQSDNMRRLYIDHLCGWAGEDTREHWEEKIVSDPALYHGMDKG